MGNYLKDKLGANVNRREQRPTHAHRYAGLACGARFRAPGGGGCARPAGGRAAVCGAPAGRVPVLRGVFIIAVHRAFVLGLGARHPRGIVVELSRG